MFNKIRTDFWLRGDYIIVQNKYTVSLPLEKHFRRWHMTRVIELEELPSPRQALVNREYTRICSQIRGQCISIGNGQSSSYLPPVPESPVNHGFEKGSWPGASVVSSFYCYLRVENGKVHSARLTCPWCHRQRLEQREWLHFPVGCSAQVCFPHKRKDHKMALLTWVWEWKGRHRK